MHWFLKEENSPRKPDAKSFGSIRKVRFTLSTLRQASTWKERTIALEKIQVKHPHQRSLCAMKFEDKSREEKDSSDETVPRWARSHRARQVGKDLGKSDPEALDELEEVEGKLFQQDTGISIYVSSGRFDIQFRVKRLSEMMDETTKAGQSSTCKAGKTPCGYREACAQIRSSRVRRHCEELPLTQIGVEARSAIPRTQGWNSMENISWIRGLHPIKCEH